MKRLLSVADLEQLRDEIIKKYDPGKTVISIRRKIGRPLFLFVLKREK